MNDETLNAKMGQVKYAVEYENKNIYSNIPVSYNGIQIMVNLSAIYQTVQNINPSELIRDRSKYMDFPDRVYRQGEPTLYSRGKWDC